MDEEVRVKVKEIVEDLDKNIKKVKCYLDKLQERIDEEDLIGALELVDDPKHMSYDSLGLETLKKVEEVIKKYGRLLSNIKKAEEKIVAD